MYISLSLSLYIYIYMYAFLQDRKLQDLLYTDAEKERFESFMGDQVYYITRYMCIYVYIYIYMCMILY